MHASRVLLLTTLALALPLLSTPLAAAAEGPDAPEVPEMPAHQHVCVYYDLSPVAYGWVCIEE